MLLLYDILMKTTIGREMRCVGNGGILGVNAVKAGYSTGRQRLWEPGKVKWLGHGQVSLNSACTSSGPHLSGSLWWWSRWGRDPLLRHSRE